MSKWIMINVVYARTPGATTYRAQVEATHVEQPEPMDAEMPVPKLTELVNIGMSGVQLEDVVERIHILLQDYPDAKVSMIQELTRDGVYKRRNGKGFELDQVMIDLIRTDLEQAKALFAPINRTVNAQVQAPRIDLKPQM